MSYKYPYIPKRLYPAVMFACKLIRENGWFNKAIEAAARWSGEDPNEIAKHVRARQGAGQRAKSSGRKYKWYAVEYCTCYERGLDYFDPAYASYTVEKATSADNAKKHVETSRERKGLVLGEHDAWTAHGRVIECDSEAEAYEMCRRMKQENCDQAARIEREQDEEAKRERFMEVAKD